MARISRIRDVWCLSVPSVANKPSKFTAADQIAMLVRIVDRPR